MTPKELSRLESLAKLSLTEEEKRTLSPELDGLLSFLGTLSCLPEDTAEADGDHPASVTREDIPAPCLSREEILSSAPDQANGFFVI